jgi:hypothetical protein
MTVVVHTLEIPCNNAHFRGRSLWEIAGELESLVLSRKIEFGMESLVLPFASLLKFEEFSQNCRVS